MQITIRTKSVDLNPGLEAFIKEKLGKIDKLLPLNFAGGVEVEIGLTTTKHQKGDIYFAELQIELPKGKKIIAIEKKDNIKTAILASKESLALQIKKYKEKIEKEKTRGGKEEFQEQI
ncbi:MAG: ribosome-associated translation inhibitor RaiA [Candidatus Paceibacterota bacterium]|jgi:ribosomal subunit interface protein